MASPGGEKGDWRAREGAGHFLHPHPQPLTGCAWACHLRSSLLPLSPPSPYCPWGAGVRLHLSILFLRYGADCGCHGASALGLPYHWGQGFPHAHRGDQGKGWLQEIKRCPHPHRALALSAWSPQTPSFFCSGTRGLLLGGLGPCCHGDVVARSGAGFWAVKGSWAKGPAGCQPHTCW